MSLLHIALKYSFACINAAFSFPFSKDLGHPPRHTAKVSASMVNGFSAPICSEVLNKEERLISPLDSSDSQKAHRTHSKPAKSSGPGMLDLA